MNVTILGIDLAKNVFQLHGVNRHGKVTLTKRVTRARLRETVAHSPRCLIGMEACAHSHYWAREFERLGHTVRLIAPQFVKPYVKTHKNDAADAAAICEAVARPSMRFVPMKSIEQQDIQAVHRIRERLVKARTAVVNQIRGLLMEYGVVIPLKKNAVSQRLPQILEEADNGLTVGMRLTASAAKIDDRITETLTFYGFPVPHWRRIRTNHPLERIMREIRRRTRVVGAFPDGKSTLMLAAARLCHIAGT